jgi:hypothetical protein
LSPLDGYFHKYFESDSKRRSTVDPSWLEPLRALKCLASFPLLSLFLLDVNLSLLFISELLKEVSAGVGVLFIVPPDSPCNRVNQDVSLLVVGCETFSSVLLYRRLGFVQSGVKRFSAGGSLRFCSFLIFLSFAVFFFFGLIHLWNDFSSCLFGKT